MAQNGGLGLDANPGERTTGSARCRTSLQTFLPSGTGVVSSYSYDNANRLTSIVHDKGGTIASASYTLDNVGNRTGRVDQQGTHSYAYDNRTVGGDPIWLPAR